MAVVFNKKTLASLAAFLLAGVVAHAQFYTTGEDPWGARWNSIETNNFKVVYPRQLDSLSREYAKALEASRENVGKSIGLAPNETYRKKQTVVLHPFGAYSNGVVVWTPRRMELYTCPDAYSPNPLPWIKDLAVHESRHVSQMQVGNSRSNRPFGWFLGEMWAGACAGLYYKDDFLEGDAVVAETALTNSGRGRTADFLNYYMIAFDNDDTRNWLKWMGGSQIHYAPNHYALGYMYYSGMRVFYNAPSLSAEYLDLLGRRPFELFTYQDKVSKRHTDSLNFNKVFPEIAAKTHAVWNENAEARKPYTPYAQIVNEPRRYTEYHGTTITSDGDLYSIKSSIDKPEKLVSIDNEGDEDFVSYFNSLSSKLAYSKADGRIYWSETVFDPRWGHKSKSVIRYRRSAHGVAHNLTHKGLLFSPSPSPDGSAVAVSQYEIDGRCAVALLSAEDGSVVARYAAPSGLQVVETAWRGEELFATVIEEGGFGIYKIGTDGSWSLVLGPEPVKISGFSSGEDCLYFTCDRNGSDELYLFYPSSGELVMKSSLRYGGTSFAYDGENAFGSVAGTDGKLLSVIPADSLISKSCSFGDRYLYPIAEELSRQERELGAKPVLTDTITVSEPKKYHKTAHLLKFHSWAPFYMNPDKIMAFSYDHYYDLIGLGATALSQNDLGTAVLQAGYCAHKDKYRAAEDEGFPTWRHSAHLKYTYSGWYPVFEATVDFNDRAVRRTDMQIITEDDKVGYFTAKSSPEHKPYVTGKLRVYIPLSWSRGGWTTGFVPEATYSISNDWTNGRVPVMLHEKVGEEHKYTEKRIKEYDVSPFNHTVICSVRAFRMLPTKETAVYPRWGVGVEAGYLTPLGDRAFYSDVAYAYAYAYTPGVIPSQGLRLTAMYQKALLSNGRLFNNAAVQTLPRGYLEAPSALSQMIGTHGSSTKFTAEYAAPIYVGDLGACGGLFYLRRLILTPHFDWSTFYGKDDTEHLYSVGATLSFDFRFLLWLNFPINIGVTYSYNGGNGFDFIKGASHHFVGPVFDISF